MGAHACCMLASLLVLRAHGFTIKAQQMQLDSGDGIFVQLDDVSKMKESMWIRWDVDEALGWWQPWSPDERQVHVPMLTIGKHTLQAILYDIRDGSVTVRSNQLHINIVGRCALDWTAPQASYMLLSTPGHASKRKKYRILPEEQVVESKVGEEDEDHPRHVMDLVLDSGTMAGRLC